MKKQMVVTLAFALIWIMARFTFSLIMPPDKASTAGVLTNLFFILVLIFVVLVLKYRSPEAGTSGFLSDMKDCMKAALTYVAVVVLYMGFHYGLISGEMEERRNALISNIEQQTDSEKELADYRSMVHNPKLTRAEIITAETEKAEFFTSLKLFIPLALLMLTLVSLIYAMLGVLLWRRFLRPG